MKKSLSIFLSILMLLSAVVLPGFASDYDSHWAKDTIELLIKNGIVSGDESGNVNPDAAISRAEFIKVINKTFRYTEKGAENFPDVDASDWYADEMAIAKKKGYIQGDAEGNGNPQDNITRTEVCVILARVLNLDTADTSLTFTDADQIADWGKGAVAALVKAEYLSGYPDGSFQGENSITRAEAFSVVGRHLKKTADFENPSENNTGDISSMGGNSSISTGGSGSGSGSGGSGSTNGGKLSAPSVSKMDPETEVIQWSKVSNASAYELELTVHGITKTVSVSGTSYDLTDTVDTVTAESEESSFEVSVRVRAIASKSGYTSSDFSKRVSYTKKYPSVDAPVLHVANKIVNKKNRVVISMDPQENIAGYAGRFLVNGAENSSMVYDESAKVFIIPDTSVIGSGKGEVEIKAVSAQKPQYRDSAYTKAEITDTAVPDDTKQGTGTKEDPYLLRTKADFELVRNNPDKHFVLMNDVDLGSFEPLPEFTGTFRSDSGQHTVTVDINVNGGDRVGLFYKLEGGAVVSDIILSGSVSGKSAVGGIVGWMHNGTIRNCINNATINGTTYVGGLVGFTGYLTAEVGKGSIENCFNLGDVIGAGSSVGGLIGYGHASIKESANLGNVSGVGSHVGGLAGMTYATIASSYNSGRVSATSKANVGGIAGGVRQSSSPITDCFNTGEIVSGDAAGGIVGGFWNASSHGALNRCYNAGTVTGAVGRTTPLGFNNIEGAAGFTYTDCFYLSETGEDDGFAGSTPLTSNQLADKTTEGLDKLMGTAYEYAAFQYPVLKAIPYYGAGELKLFDFDMGLKGVYENGNMLLSWNPVTNPEITGIELTVINNNNFQTILERQLVDAAENTFAVPGCKEQNPYEVIVRLKYGESLYSTEKIYEVIPYSGNTLEKPVLSPVPSGSTVVNWNAVENAGSYALKAVLGQIQEVIPVNGTSYDLESWIAEKTAGSSQAVTQVTVSVKAVAGSTEYSDSPYSDEITVTRTLPTLDTPQVELRSRAVDGKNRVVIAVAKDENASGYQGKFVIGSAENSTMQYDAEKNLFIIPDTSVIGDAEAYVEIKAISGDSQLLDSEALKVKVVHTPVPAAGDSGDGSAENPFQLRTKEDFEQVRSNPDKHFVVMNDIDLGDYTPIPEFTGTITSGGDKKYILTVNINSTTENTGLFAVLGSADAKASVSNLVIAGSITATLSKNNVTANVGSVAGKLINADVSGCINMATIKATGMYIGGIIGNAYDGVVTGSTVSNCYNTGNFEVTGMQVGGIIGRSNIVINACGNTGTVRAQSVVGGIVGLSGADVIDCYHSGKVVAHTGGQVGGIIGQWAANFTVSGCFSTGLVLGDRDGRGGGLIGAGWSPGKTLTVSNCYSSSTFSKRAAGDTAGDEIAIPLVNTVTSCTYILTNCYYVSEGSVDDGLEGSTLVAQEELKDAGNACVQSLLSAGYIFDNTNNIPVLSTPEYYAPGGLTFTPSVPFSLEITGSFEGGSLKLNLAAASADEITGIELTIYDGYDLTPVTQEVLAADASSYTLENTEAGHTYIVVCKAVFADDSKSDEVSAEFTAE